MFFYVDILKKIYLLHIFRLENSLYFMKHDPEDKIFYLDRNRYIPQENSNTACRQ